MGDIADKEQILERVALWLGVFHVMQQIIRVIQQHSMQPIIN